jgi:vacuolar-type H+-ATPase subunit I/STV1
MTRVDMEVTPGLIPAVVMRVPSGLMLGFVVGLTPPEVVIRVVPSGLILGFVVGLTPWGVVIKVPSALILGFVVGLTPWGVVMKVPSGLILGFVVGLVMGAVLGLVPGPPGPKPGEGGVFEEEGELDAGKLEEGPAELLSPPPHPVRVMEVHKIYRQTRRVDNHVAIKAFIRQIRLLEDEPM